MRREITSLILAITVAFTVPAPTVFAGETAQSQETKSFHYVALGDSIASGYGLYQRSGIEDMANDPALVLHSQDEANVLDSIATAEEGHTLVPVEGAYPYIFYDSSLKKIAEEKGYTTDFANLSSTAFSAEAVCKTIQTSSNETYQCPPMAEYMLDQMTAVATEETSNSASELVKNYPAIYSRYLKDADLVSIQLGGNDIMDGIILDMENTENPVLQYLSLAMALVMVGCDTDEIAEYLVTVIESDSLTSLTLPNGETVQSDNMTIQNIIDAVEYIDSSHMTELESTYEKEALDNLSAVIEAVRGINNDEDNLEIALLNLFNPFGNSLEYDSDSSGIASLVNEVINSCIQKVLGQNSFTSSEYETPDVVNDANEDNQVTMTEAEDITHDMEQNGNTVETYMDDLDKQGSLLGVSGDDLLKMSYSQITELVGQSSITGTDASTLINTIMDDLSAIKVLLSAVSSEVLYPVQYLLLGQNFEDTVDTFNNDLKNLIENSDYKDHLTYVDVYDIPNESNMDPHPDAEGHQAIAALMGDQLSELISSKMESEKTTEDYTSSETQENVNTTPALKTTTNPASSTTANTDNTKKMTKEESVALTLNAGLKVSTKGRKIKVSWKKVSGADGYQIYAACCGSNGEMKKVKTIKGSSKVSAVIRKVDGKRISKNKVYKVYVRAYKLVKGKKVTIGHSMMAYIAGSKSAYGNAKRVKISSSANVKLQTGQSSVIKARIVLTNKKKNILPDSYTSSLRYASSNANVATVTSSGAIKGIGRGTCYIYVYAQNGYANKVKVTVN